MLVENLRAKLNMDRDGVRVGLVVITPDEAKDLLENHNNINRDLHKPTAMKYQEMMEKGRWIPGCARLDFAEDNGVLETLNGQHGLWAIMQSGAEQLMVVTVGLPREAIKVFDTPRKRTNRDTLSIHQKTGEIQIGFDDNLIPRIAALLNRLIEQQGIRVNNEKVYEKINNLDVDAVFDRYGMTASIVAPFKGDASWKAAALAALISGEDQARIIRFCDLVTADNLGVLQPLHEESAATALNVWLKELKGDFSQRSNRKNVYFKTEHALDKFLRNQPLQKITNKKYDNDEFEEKFPVNLSID